MSFAERPYQRDLDARIVDAWAHGARDVLAVLPTGGGKTVVFSNIISREPGASVAIAHRQELVGQMSLALARNAVRHKVVAPGSVQAACVALHMAELGRHFVDPTARAAAAGIDTLVRMDRRDPWLAQVQLAVTDEGHHVLAGNKWGKGLLMFPNARGLAVTATPVRADGKGLGRHADGIMDCLVEGPGMRDLIRQGYLTDYRIFAPPTDLDLSDVGVSAGGDYSPPALKKAVSRSHITGDAVEHYLRIAPGKLGVCFANDIDHATKITEAFRAAGVAAELVTSHTPDAMRAQIMRRFRARQVTMLVNVDLFGEGFDLPALGVVIMARPTKSFALYCQQFGRVLRLLEGKAWGIIIDMVGNVESFARTRGLPDTPQQWTLDARERTSKSKPSDAVPVRTCLNATCLAVYERVLDCCPYCGDVPAPAGRSSPKEVDGVLHELDVDVLRALRREVERIDGPFHAPAGMSDIARRGAANQHKARQIAQQGLREAMAIWGGWQESLGRSAAEAQRRFFFCFGVDSLTASALGAREATELEIKVREHLKLHGVTVREAKTEGERIREWFEQNPAGGDSFEVAAAIGLTNEKPGWLIRSALDENWRKVQIRRNNVNKEVWRHVDFDEASAVREWFSNHVDQVESKKAIEELGLPAITIARALKDTNWRITKIKRNGVGAAIWRKTNRIKEWFDSMPDGTSTDEANEKLNLGNRRSAGLLIGRELKGSYKSVMRMEKMQMVGRWYRINKDNE